MRRSVGIAAAITLVLSSAACKKEQPPPEAAATRTSGGAVAASSASLSAVATDAPNAEVGKPAPDFTLKDLDGRDVRLSDYKGKVIVLEWFNPGCPYVKMSHTKGSLKDAAARHTKDGVVWLAINSGAPGKDGAGSAPSREAAKTFGMTHPILLDPTGAVGHKYGATNTPHMFVIDAKGTLVYKGAIDNSPDGEGQSPTGPSGPREGVVAYVDETLASVASGKTIAAQMQETKAYGCSVKYAH
jgi:peroxiredoxin